MIGRHPVDSWIREGGNELPLAHCRHGLVLLADQHGMGYVNPIQPAGGVEPAQVTAGGQHPGKHPGPRFLPRPFVEYSGAHWSVFFLAEYINTFAIAALTVLLFLGGWLFPGLPSHITALGFLVVLVKTYMVILVIFWIRGTYPRLRIDQLMSLGWKVLVPLAFLNIVITGFYMFYNWPAWSLTLMSLLVIVATVWIMGKRMKTSPTPQYTVTLYRPPQEVTNAR